MKLFKKRKTRKDYTKLAKEIKEKWKKVKLAPGTLEDFAYAERISRENIEIIPTSWKEEGIEHTRQDKGVDYHEIEHNLDRDNLKGDREWIEGITFAQYLLKSGIETIVGYKGTIEDQFNAGNPVKRKMHYGWPVKIKK